MSLPKNIELIKSGKWKEAIFLWKERLERDALDLKVLPEIKKGKEYLADSPVDIPRDEVLAELDLLSTFYPVSSLDPFRETKGNLRNGPTGDIALHPDGRFVVADEIRHRIQFFSPEGNFLSSFGEKGALPGQFCYPKRVCCALDGSLYVADAWNHRLQQFDADGKFIRKFGQYGHEKGHLNEPHGIAMGSNRWIYLLDRCNHRVQVLDEDFRHVGLFGRRGTPWEEDMACLYSTPPEKFFPPAFEFPSDIKTDNHGNIYIADCNNHRVQKLNAYGTPLLEWGGKGSSHGAFFYPQSIAIDTENNIFVADMNNHRIQRFTSTGEFVYSIVLPGSNTDAMAVPVALACGNGKLYAGMGFSPRILVFQYHAAIPEGLARFRDKFPREGKEEHAPLSRYSQENIFCADLREGNVPAGKIQELQVLARETDVLKDEIGLIKREWMELASFFVPAREKRTLYILEGKESELEFDEGLYQLDKKNRELERKLKEKLVRLKRAHENLHRIQSKAISRCRTENFSSLKPLYENCLDQTKKLSHWLAELLSEGEDAFSQLERAYQVFMKDPKEGRAEFKKGYHLRELTGLLHEQVSTALGFGILNLKDWVLALKSSAASSAEWEKLFVEISEGELGSSLDGILQKTSYNWGMHNSLSCDIRALLSALNRAVIPSTCFVPSTLTPLFQNPGEGKNKALYPLSLLYFREETPQGEVRVGTSVYSSEALSSGEIPDTALNTILNFTGKAATLVPPIREFINNERLLSQHLQNTKALLKSGAASDEKVAASNLERLLLLDFQENLNLGVMAKLFMNFQWDYRHLFPVLFYLKKNQPDKMADVYSKLAGSMEKYKNLMAELHDLAAEKEKEFEKSITETHQESNVLPAPEGTPDPETAKNLIVKFLSLLHHLQIRLADLVALHERLNEIARPSSFSAPPPQSLVRHVKIEPDLVIGGGVGLQLGKLHSPSGVRANQSKELFVCSYTDHRITKFSFEGTLLGEMKGFGEMPSKFIHPMSVTFDSRGNVYIAAPGTPPQFTDKRVQKISSNGDFLFPIGGIGQDDMKEPIGTLVDEKGRIWVNDFGNGKLYIYSNDGRFIKSIGGKGTNPGEFNIPFALEQRENGDIAVSESVNRRIQILDQEGNPRMFYSTHGIQVESISGLANGPRGSLFAADFWGNRIYLFDENGRPILSFGGRGYDGGEFHGPAGLTCHDNFLFICDMKNHRIQRFDVNHIMSLL